VLGALPAFGHFLSVFQSIPIHSGMPSEAAATLEFGLNMRNVPVQFLPDAIFMSVRFTPTRLALSLAAVLLTPGLSGAQAQSAAPAAALRATLSGIEVTGALPIITEDTDSYTLGAMNSATGLDLSMRNRDDALRNTMGITLIYGEPRRLTRGLRASF
jgi:hypothetical protein